MYTIDESNRKEHVYPTYGRRFVTYKWYKPLFAAALAAIVYAVIGGVLLASIQNSMDAESFGNMVSGGYDNFDIFSVKSAVLNLGGVALLIPAVWIGALIVRDRPISSYSSARGGWSHKVFFRTLPIAIVCIALPDFIVTGVSEGFNIDMKFTTASLIAVTILGPLQCIAEEYAFRGLFMQTLGSWFRLPIIAVVLQSAIFAAAHPYNKIGVAIIFIDGIIFGLVAWIGRGIEVSSAMHVANNMSIFYMLGFGMGTLSSQQTMEDLWYDVITSGAYLIAIFIISKKTDWFNTGKKDDVAVWNAKYEAKRAAKAAKKAAKIAAKAAKKGGEAVKAVAADFTAGQGAALNESAAAEPEAIEAATETAAEAVNGNYSSEASADSAAESVPDFKYSGRANRSSSAGGKHFKSK